MLTLKFIFMHLSAWRYKQQSVGSHSGEACLIELMVKDYM